MCKTIKRTTIFKNWICLLCVCVCIFVECEGEWSFVRLDHGGEWSFVRFERCTAVSTDNSFPGFPIKWDVTKSSGDLHVCNFCTTTAPWTCSCHRFRPPQHPPLIHQKAETRHWWISIDVLLIFPFFFAEWSLDCLCFCWRVGVMPSSLYSRLHLKKLTITRWVGGG